MVNFKFYNGEEVIVIEDSENVMKSISTSLNNNSKNSHISLESKEVEEPKFRNLWKDIKEIDLTQITTFIVAMNEVELIKIDNVKEREFNCSYTIDFSRGNFIEHIDFNIE